MATESRWTWLTWGAIAGYALVVLIALAAFAGWDPVYDESGSGCRSIVEKDGHAVRAAIGVSAGGLWLVAVTLLLTVGWRRALRSKRARRCMVTGVVVIAVLLLGWTALTSADGFSALIGGMFLGALILLTIGIVVLGTWLIERRSDDPGPADRWPVGPVALATAGAWIVPLAGALVLLPIMSNGEVPLC